LWRRIVITIVAVAVLVRPHPRPSGRWPANAAAGDVAWFDGDQGIAPHALEPSTALNVIAQREE
jgi:hypothetical protein